MEKNQKVKVRKMSTLVMSWLNWFLKNGFDIIELAKESTMLIFDIYQDVIQFLNKNKGLSNKAGNVTRIILSHVFAVKKEIMELINDDDKTEVGSFIQTLTKDYEHKFENIQKKMDKISPPPSIF